MEKTFFCFSEFTKYLTIFLLYFLRRNKKIKKITHLLLTGVEVPDDPT